MTRRITRALAVLLITAGAAVLVFVAPQVPGESVVAVSILGLGWIAGGVWFLVDRRNRP